MAAYEACYVFKSDAVYASDRAAKFFSKSRKTLENTNLAPRSNNLPFVSLFSGSETLSSKNARAELFDRVWSQQEKPIKELSDSSNLDATNEIGFFIHSTHTIRENGKIPTGFIVAGPSRAADANLFESIADYLKSKERISMVILDSMQTPNLKSALKCINGCATPLDQNLIDDEDIDSRRKNYKYLSYDLQILHHYVQENSISKIILSFRDSEAFEGDLLADLIDILSSWSDRIPFIMLFGIATSLEMFQEKVPQAMARHLQGVRFDLAHLDIEDVFKTATHSNTVGCLWVGPGLTKVMIQRHKDYIQCASTFTQDLKYIYMTYFFANPLSILLNSEISNTELQSEHYEALRNLPSFQTFIESLLEQGDYHSARKSLDDDEFLIKIVLDTLKRNQESLQNILQAVDIIFAIQSSSFGANAPWSELYISAMAGELRSSSLMKDALLWIRKAPSNVMSDLLTNLSVFSIPNIAESLQDLQILMTKNDQNARTPFRSDHDIRYQNIHTTIVAQKVELSKQTSALSEQDLQYSKLVNRVEKVLKDFFETFLINPQTLFLREIIIYDLKSPHRDVFSPKPRLAVERALSSPHEYLGCECCEGLENTLSPLQPTTAILYQLYLESGAVINAADLWSAFHEIVGNGDCEDEDTDQQRASAHFLRGLAELKYMGMIKTSRKKVDHLTKLIWKGL